ncbi:MAG: hypothetical protein JNL94_06050 [Planctomycetes bacterium]|nr:hypothetical protein [Planctomycetota bacterium]
MRTFACVAALGIALPWLGCASDLPPAGIAEPVTEWSNQFSVVTRDGDVYFAGLPTRGGLATAVDDGVTTVVSLLPEAEERRVLQFDEAAEVARLGARFVRIPVTAESFSAADVDAFANAWAESEGKVLLHCASSNRAGGMWAAYLIRHASIPQGEALGAGMNAGLNSQGMVDAVKRVASTP